MNFLFTIALLLNRKIFRKSYLSIKFGKTLKMNVRFSINREFLLHKETQYFSEFTKVFSKLGLCLGTRGMRGLIIFQYHNV